MELVEGDFKHFWIKVVDIEYRSTLKIDIEKYT